MTEQYSRSRSSRYQDDWGVLPCPHEERNRAAFQLKATMNDLLPEKDALAVLDILSEKLDVDRTQLTREARLVEDLNSDSLTLVEINMALEERFNISIPDERIEKVQTVGDVFELLAELLQPPGRHS